MLENENVKALTIEYLEELESLNTKMEEVIINGVSIKVCRFFKKTEIRKLIMEALKIFYENKLDQKQTESTMFPYLNLLMIKYFTSLEMSGELDSQLRVMEILINNDLLVPILDEFPSSEKDKVLSEFTEMIFKINEFIDNADGEFDKLVDKLDIENKDEMFKFIGRK